MVERSITAGDLNFANFLLTVPALFISLALAFFGFQSNNLGLLVAGLVLFLLPITGLVLPPLTGNNILKSEKSGFLAALAYLAGFGVFVVPSLLGRVSFSFSATPSQSYLAAALGETSVEVTSIMNNYLAPAGENMAILGLAVVLLSVTRQVTDNKLVQGAAVILPTSIAFALLHGVRSPVFFLFAGGFMALWAILYIGDDLGISYIEDLALAGFAATVGLHRGNNVAASGGLFEYYGTILSAPSPIIYLSYLIVLIDVILLGYVVFKTVELVSDGSLGDVLSG
jgi:hypothetical protein